MAARAAGGERGQSTVEWVALVLLLSLALVGTATLASAGLPGTQVPRAIAAKLVCAAGLERGCERPADELAAEYGPELAALARDHAPTVHFAERAQYLPVDHRECREPACAAVSGSGEIATSATGLPATAFVRVVDCRPQGAAVTVAGGADCSGERAGRAYLQYWLYYPDSRTRPWGELGHHPDDWESLQVRIGDRVEARASSHRSYSHRGGIRNWPTEAGLWRKSGWGPYAGELHVAAGSHAGNVRRARRGARHVPAGRLRLVPIEPLAAIAGRDHDFAVTPPWLKQVYLDPEAQGT